MRTSYGAVLRGAGGNPRAIERAGWSLLRARSRCSRWPGVFGVLAGLALIGLTTSAEANIAERYTLLSIAGVILGGGEFVGGRVSPVGAVHRRGHADADGSFLAFLRIPPDWQIGAQGAILIVVLALRAVIDRVEAQAHDDPRPPARQALALVLRRRARGLARDHGLHRGPGRRPACITAALTFATFFVIVGIGQMFVITLGPGNVDLSIPATMALAGSVAMKIMDTQDSMILVGLAVGARLRPRRRRLQLRADPRAAHPADHRHALVELRHPVRRHRLRPRAAHQAAADARRLHHGAGRRRAGPRDLRRRCSRR